MSGTTANHHQSATAWSSFGAGHREGAFGADSDLNRRVVVKGQVAECARNHQPTRPQVPDAHTKWYIGRYECGATTDLYKRTRPGHVMLDVVGASNAIDIFSSLIELREDGAVEQRQRGVSGDWGRWTVAAFHAESNRAVHSDVWERHPLGDELLCLLSGAITVHLRNHADGESATMQLRPTTCCVVPAGQWHRLTVEEPGDLVAITPRVDTAHEAVSEG